LDALTRQSPAPMIVDVVCIGAAAYLFSTRLTEQR
jgi:hypothetical protein